MKIYDKTVKCDMHTISLSVVRAVVIVLQNVCH